MILLQRSKTGVSSPNKTNDNMIEMVGNKHQWIKIATIDNISYTVNEQTWCAVQVLGVHVYMLQNIVLFVYLCFE